MNRSGDHVSRSFRAGSRRPVILALGFTLPSNEPDAALFVSPRPRVRRFGIHPSSGHAQSQSRPRSQPQMRPTLHRDNPAQEQPMPPTTHHIHHCKGPPPLAVLRTLRQSLLVDLSLSQNAPNKAFHARPRSRRTGNGSLTRGPRELCVGLVLAGAGYTFIPNRPAIR